MQISKRNRRGVLILAGIVLVIIYSPRILANLQSGNKLEVSFDELDKEESEIIQGQFQKESDRRAKKVIRKYRLPEKRFDPNEYTKSDWVKLGLTEKQGDVIMRFSKYGIRSNDELKKIFVIPEELFDLIKDSTFYPEVAASYRADEKESVKKIDLDLNSATFEELLELKGIGEYYAKKIVEYRAKLGGFVSKEQLLEIWKFTPDKLSEIESSIHITAGLSQLNINSATYEQLSAHPYISYKVANSIVKMREQRGDFKSKIELKESKLIDNELYNKLEPYIKL